MTRNSPVRNIRTVSPRSDRMLPAKAIRRCPPPRSRGRCWLGLTGPGRPWPGRPWPAARSRRRRCSRGRAAAGDDVASSAFRAAELVVDLGGGLDLVELGLDVVDGGLEVGQRTGRREARRSRRPGPACRRSCPGRAASPHRRRPSTSRSRRRPRRPSSAPRPRCSWPSSSPSWCGTARPAPGAVGRWRRASPPARSTWSCWVFRSASCSPRAARRASASRARSSLLWASAALAWSCSLSACFWSWPAWSSIRLRAVATSATLRRTFWRLSSCFSYDRSRVSRGSSCLSRTLFALA